MVLVLHRYRLGSLDRIPADGGSELQRLRTITDFTLGVLRYDGTCNTESAWDSLLSTRWGRLGAASNSRACESGIVTLVLLDYYAYGLYTLPFPSHPSTINIHAASVFTVWSLDSPNVVPIPGVYVHAGILVERIRCEELWILWQTYEKWITKNLYFTFEIKYVIIMYETWKQ